LKPENILLKSKEDDCEIKLADFGLAIVWKNKADPISRCGTPGYVAPEILNPKPTRPLSEKVDVFSLGSIFYRVLTGTKLFPGTTAKVVLKANRDADIYYSLK